jgi:hypothetical protein
MLLLAQNLPTPVGAFIGSNRLDTTGSTTVASLTTTGINTTGGSGSVMHVQAVVSTASGTPTLTDNKGNTGWTLVSSASRGIGATYYLWRFVAPAGGTGHTFTVTLGIGTGPITAIVVETLQCQLDATANYTADSTAPYTVGITTTGSSDVVLVFNSSDTAGYGSPFASLQTYVDTGSGWSLSSGFATGVAAGAQTITVNSAGSTDFQIAAVALNAASTAITGASSQTLGAVTQTAAGTVRVSGASALTLGSITQSSAGSVAITGASSQALGSVTQAASGVVGSAPITGASTLTLSAITGAAAGSVAVAGSHAATLAAITGSAAGAVAIAGSQAATLGSITQASAGTILVTGAAAQTMGAVTGSAAGSVAVTGASSITLGAVTGTAAGTVTSGVTGTSSQTLGAFTGAGAGTVSLSGSASQPLGAVTQAAAGTVAIVGASSQTIGAVTQSAAGTAGAVGASSLTLSAITGSAAGGVRVAGAQAVPLGSISQAAAGTVSISGAASQTVGQVSQSAAGSVAITGASSQALAGVTGSGAGTVVFAPITGTGAATLGAILAATTGQILIRGAGSGTLGSITGFAVGTSGRQVETIADDTAPFFSSLAITGTWGALSARLLFDEPTEDILNDLSLSTEYRATMQAEDWPDITRGDTVTIGAGTYRVRGVDILGDGRIKAVSLMLTAGTGPATFADDATAGGFFDAQEFGRVATFGARTAVVLLDAPADDVLVGRAMSREYAMRYRAADLPGLVRGSTVSIDGSTYTVREARRIGDGATLAADLTLKTGPGPAAFAFDADLSAFFEIPGFAVRARWGAIDAQVLFDLPGGDILGGTAQSAGYLATVRTADWPGIARGASVSIAPHTYTVREVRHVGDGATVELRMTRQ